jgi:hypothetical protein
VKCKTKTLNILISFLLLSFLLSNVYASSNINLYFPSGTSIGFQSLGSDYFSPIEANVTVASGTLNGTNVALSMSVDSGSLSFTSLDTATLSPYNVTITVGSTVYNETTTIHSGNHVIFRWKAERLSTIITKLFSLPFFLVGLIGVGCTAPMLALAGKYRKKEILIGAFIFGSIGIVCLIVFTNV